MASFCKNCGCKSYNGACTNCHEEIYIMQQYEELEMPVPQMIEDKVAEHYKEISKQGTTT